MRGNIRQAASILQCRGLSGRQDAALHGRRDACRHTPVSAESRLKIAPIALVFPAMLEDRDYMRQPEFDGPHWVPHFHPRWSWTVALLAVYAIVFVAEILVSPTPRQLIPGNDFCYKYFALSKDGLAHGFVWQLLTYQFMHVGLLHLLLNSWAIYVFGRELEAMLGGARFLTLMFSSGVVGGVFQVLAAWVWPQLFGGAVVGASACAFGLVAAFAMIYPERELMMLIFFVIPVHMRAKTLLIFSAVLAVGGVVFPLTNVANAAHLGGMAMGWFFVRKIMRADWSRLEGTLRVFSKTSRSGTSPAPHHPVEKSALENVTDEVDPILDKISAQGIQSLTARERAVLEAARKKMSQR
jgi:membrane associated rhomboid family serine protease